MNGINYDVAGHFGVYTVYYFLPVDICLWKTCANKQHLKPLPSVLVLPQNLGAVCGNFPKTDNPEFKLLFLAPFSLLNNSLSANERLPGEKV